MTHKERIKQLLNSDIEDDVLIGMELVKQEYSTRNRWNFLGYIFDTYGVMFYSNETNIWKRKPDNKGRYVIIDHDKIFD